MRAAEATALAALAMVAPAAARADGAFPAVQTVLVPADRPQETILATNFGLVFSEDGGQTWSWTCEQDANAYAIFYQLGPAPRHRLFAVANQHVIYSDDSTCTWRVAGGLLAGQTVTDVFPDPTNADRVLAIAIANGADRAAFESADGGTTFDAMLYQAAAGDALNGVEIARSDPRVVYLALTGADGGPRLARTSDAGAHWTVSDLSAGLGPGSARIIAVDPDDANTVLLRWTGIDGNDAIGLTRDGGATVSKTLSIQSNFTSFARMPDGALVLGGNVFLAQKMIPALFVSHDGGATFAENDAVPGIVALAQRGGVLYGAADNFVDGFALGSSSDEGVTWQPVLRFDQVGSIAACLRTNAQCQASCEALAGNGLGSPGKIWEETVCAGTGGSLGTGGAGGAAGAAGSGGAAGSAGGSSGCGCALAHGGPKCESAAAVSGAALFGLVLLLRGPRRRNAGGRSGPDVSPW